MKSSYIKWIVLTILQVKYIIFVSCETCSNSSKSCVIDLQKPEETDSILRLQLAWNFVVTDATSAYFTIIFLVILLPTIAIYTTLKDLKENVRLQLFMFYLVYIYENKLVALLTFYKLYSRFLGKSVLDTLAHTSSLSTILWLNVISCEIWHTSLKPINAEKNLRKDRKRLLWYIIYTHGMVMIVTLLQNHTVGTTWYTWSTVGVIFIFLMINLITFILLSLYICRTRLEVARMMNTRNFAGDMSKIILRLFVIMGISRLIVFAIIYVWRVNGVLMMQIVEILEAVLIFLLFVMKENIRKLLKSKFACCCGKAELTTSDL